MPATLPHDLAPFLVDLALKATFLLVLAWAAAWDLRRSSAARRHLLWTLTVLALLALPLVSSSLPSWRVPLSLPWSTVIQATPSSVNLLSPPGPGQAPNPKKHAGPSEPVLVASGMAIRMDTPPDETSSPEGGLLAENTVGQWLFFAWLGGAVVVLAALTAGLFSLWRLQESCRPVPPELSNLARQLGASLGIRRRSVRCWHSPKRAIPMTWGLFRPVILLPDEALRWPPLRLRLVLLHELTHVARWDCLIQMLGHLARALYWFHPLVWYALFRLRIEQENVCDDLVLSQGAPVSDYSEHLLSVTAGLPAQLFSSPLAMAIAPSARLRQRLRSLLDTSRDRRPVTQATRTLTCVTAIALLCLTSSVAFQQRAAAVPVNTRLVLHKIDPPVELRRLAEIHDRLRENHVQPLDRQLLADQTVRALLDRLKDPYTEYIPPGRSKDLGERNQAVRTGTPSLADLGRAQDGPYFDTKRKIAYIRIHFFGESTGQRLSQILRDWQNDGAKGLVLDLRFCPGGLFHEAVAVARLFVERGTLVTLRRPDKEDKLFLADRTCLMRDIPLVVLINEGTTSGAEILAGALHDHGRAVLVGTRSFGKGSVQAVLRLSDGGLLRTTTAHAYTPKGHNIQKRPGDKAWGIDPSEGFYVPTAKARKGSSPVAADTSANLSSKEASHDFQLAAALAAMAARLDHGKFVPTGMTLDMMRSDLVDDLHLRRERLLRELQSLDQEIQNRARQN